MTREEAKELLPIIRAFVNGRVIEQKIRGLENWKEPENDLDLLGCDEFRIKPEPKYRPFRTQEECWNEMHNHPDFGWIKNKATGYYINIGKISKSRNGSPLITRATNEGYNFSVSELFSDCTFTDGEPFGVKEELL